MVLNNAAASTTSGGANAGTFNYAHPSATVFTIGDLDLVNTNTEDYIAYCFHSVDGYSKVGSYTGNASANGTFVYTGFRPAFVMIKHTTTGSTNWVMWDNKRDVNEIDKWLAADSGGVEGTGAQVDFLSNGFKLRDSEALVNHNAVFIYLAFAETPFKYSNAK